MEKRNQRIKKKKESVSIQSTSEHDGRAQSRAPARGPMSALLARR